MAKPIKTNSVVSGENTHSTETLPSPFHILNKHPDYDYSFQRIESMGKGSSFGYWQVVDETNNDGESLAFNSWKANKTSGTFTYLDVILCRRPKHITEKFNKFVQQRTMGYNGVVKRSAESMFSGKIPANQRNLVGMDESNQVSVQGGGMGQYQAPTQE